MNRHETVLQTVLDALAEVNAERPPDKQLSLTREATLYGKGSTLDSIALVYLVVGVEQRLEEQHGIRLTIADDKAFGQASNPFRSVGSLVDYIVHRLEEGAHA